MLLTDQQISEIKMLDALAEAIDKALSSYEGMSDLAASTTVLHLAATAALAVIMSHNRGLDVAEDVTAGNGHVSTKAGPKKSKTWRCRTCSETFSDRSALHTHQKKAHP